ITMPTPKSSPQPTPSTKDLFFIMIPFAVVVDEQHTRQDFFSVEARLCWLMYSQCNTSTHFYYMQNL
ncbi:MAG: hypothetical protein NZ744_05870, partial [Pirellulaceae bacterium]|nr:hypothetical protein [Pirellulaceae bacterium]